MLMYWILLGSSLALSAFLTWTVRNFCNRHGLAFEPSSDRHVHTHATPRLGGVAIFFSFAFVFSAYLMFKRYSGNSRPVGPDLIRLLPPAAILFVAGLLDDLRGLGPRTKLLVQIIGGATLYMSGLRFLCIDLPNAPLLGSVICFGITVFWVVLICNSINLIDGLDGLAGGSVLFSMGTIFVVALIGGRPGAAACALVLAGSIIGFLFFNLRPSSIFLGDSGSLFIGFLLAGLVMAESRLHHNIFDSIFLPLIALALPVAETSISVIRRFLSGRALFHPDREHIHHRLLDLGFSHRGAVTVLWCTSATFAGLSLFLLHHSDFVAISVATIVVLILISGLRALRYQEFVEFTRAMKRTVAQRRALARNIRLSKTISPLARTHDTEGILQLLQTALSDDFEGVEIHLHQVMGNPTSSAMPWDGTLRRTWQDSSFEKITILLELSTSTSGMVGQISLYRAPGKPMLLDLGILTGEFRSALSTAIENCIAQTAQPLPFAAVRQDASVWQNKPLNPYSVH